VIQFERLCDFVVNIVYEMWHFMRPLYNLSDLKAYFDLQCTCFMHTFCMVLKVMIIPLCGQSYLLPHFITASLCLCLFVCLFVCLMFIFYFVHVSTRLTCPAKTWFSRSELVWNCTSCYVSRIRRICKHVYT